MFYDGDDGELNSIGFAEISKIFAMQDDFLYVEQHHLVEFYKLYIYRDSVIEHDIYREAEHADKHRISNYERCLHQGQLVEL